MRDILTVMKFTMKEMVKRKSFIVSTLIILVFIVAGCNVPRLMKKINGNANATTEKLLISDSENVFDGNLDVIKSLNLNYEIQITKDSFEEIKEKIEKDEIDSAIIVEKQDNNIKMRYIVENASRNAEVPEDVVVGMDSLYMNMQINKLGLNEEQIKSITPNFEFSIEQTADKEVKGNVWLMMILSMVLFFAVYFCAYQVSSSITTEKTSKIMETLVTSASPKTIVLGKTIGIGLVGLLQVVVIAGTAVASAKAFLDPELINKVLDVSCITPTLAIVTIIYFILGYLTYAFLYALTGSTVSKPEDIQSANMPIAIISVVGFYLAYFTMMKPTSSLNKIASILPISSPFCMPLRMMMGLAETKDIIISIVVLVITIILIAKIAIKIYSNAILNYGSKMSVKDMIKVYRDKSN